MHPHPAHLATRQAQQEITCSSNLLPERPHLPLSLYWFAALTTSLTVMRPPAPEPSISERSTPSCSAFCLAACVASGSSSSTAPDSDSESPRSCTCSVASPAASCACSAASPAAPCASSERCSTVS